MISFLILLWKSNEKIISFVRQKTNKTHNTHALTNSWSYFTAYYRCPFRNRVGYMESTVDNSFKACLKLQVP